MWTDSGEFSGPGVFAKELVMLCVAGYRIKDFGDGRGLCVYKPESLDTSKITVESCLAAFDREFHDVSEIFKIIKDSTDL